MEHGQSIGIERLRAATDRAIEATQRVGLTPPELDQDPTNVTVHSYAAFFNTLVGQLAGLKEALDATLDDEGRQVGSFVARRILSRLHHQDPNLPLDVIFQRITSAMARAVAEEAMDTHVAQVVDKLQCHDKA